ncbi:hypothetical protein BRPE64_BCDS00630 [Caballeronia insecticola]|uniref:Uncharacterized protein n=1 Tax=Caballeronia insecticola TaxID=758793 RepID=R4WJW0_9BURK|nr:hypothetical protein BRPE64_BCDS00630 [Caballeronia insecticola]
METQYLNFETSAQSASTLIFCGKIGFGEHAGRLDFETRG